MVKLMVSITLASTLKREKSNCLTFSKVGQGRAKGSSKWMVKLFDHSWTFRRVHMSKMIRLPGVDGITTGWGS